MNSLAGRKKNGGSKRRTQYERFADAVVEGLKPSFDGIRGELGGIRGELVDIRGELGDIRSELVGIHTTLDDHGRKLDDHGRKLDQLISGAVGVGRFHALEERVAALEQRR